MWVRKKEYRKLCALIMGAVIFWGLNINSYASETTIDSKTEPEISETKETVLEEDVLGPILILEEDTVEKQETSRRTPQSAESIQQMIDEAEDGSVEITLEDNLGMDRVLTIPEGREVVMEGESHELSRNGSYTGSYFHVEQGASLVLKNVTLDGGAPEWSMNYDGQIPYNKVYINVPVIYGETEICADAPLIKNEGELTMESCTLQNARAATAGSAVEQAGKLTAVNCIFQHNLSDKTNVMGGAVCLKTGSVTEFRATSFLNNTAGILGGFSYGGAIAATGSGTGTKLTIKEDCRFEENFAQGNGGAIYVVKTELNVENSVFKKNKVGNDGGAFWLSNRPVDEELVNPQPVCSFTEVKFEENEGLALTEQSLGGGVYVEGWYGEEILFKDCAFQKNKASNGGAIADQYPSQIHMSGCRLEENGAAWSGGAIYAQTLELKIEGSSITGNKAQYGSAVMQIMLSQIILEDTQVTKNQCNSSSLGGTFMLYGSSNFEKGPCLELGKNAAITENSSAALGGGILVYNPGGRQPLEVKMQPGSQIYHNTAEESGDDVVVVGTRIKVELLPGPDMNVTGINGWFYDIEGTFADDKKLERYADSQNPVKYNLNGESSLPVYLKAAGTYDIQYEGNGEQVQDIPEPHVKKHDYDTNFRSETPVREGYIFQGWNTQQDGNGKAAQPGELYTDNQDIVLWAQWKSENSGGDNPHTPDEQDTPTRTENGKKHKKSERNTETESVEQQVEQQSVQAARTGDETNLWLPAAAILLSMIGAGGYWMTKRKGFKEDH